MVHVVQGGEERQSGIWNTLVQRVDPRTRYIPRHLGRTVINRGPRK
jgi:hypothetical protein